MIVVNGMEYRTLDQDLYADGEKVVEAYCNNKLVYPERENTRMLKVVGHINTIIGHDHTGENPSDTSGAGDDYTYHGGDNYVAKGCFSLVLRNHTGQLSYEHTPTLLPSAKWPLNNAYSGSDSDGDIYGPGNIWLVFPYAGGGGLIPTTGNGIHPLLGSEAMETHKIDWGGNTRDMISAELLLYLNVSAPRICPWSSDECHIGTGYPFLDAEATPKKEYLTELPGDVNGMHRMYLYKRDIYFGLSWDKYGLTGRRFTVNLAPVARSRNTFLCSHLKISTFNGYEVPYTIRGTRNGVDTEGEYTFTQNFKILNIPITDLIYSGNETAAPEEFLHPRLEDIIEYM